MFIDVKMRNMPNVSKLCTCLSI